MGQPWMAMGPLCEVEAKVAEEGSQDPQGAGCFLLCSGSPSLSCGAGSRAGLLASLK